LKNAKDINDAFDIIKEVEGKRAEETAKINEKIDKVNEMRTGKTTEVKSEK